MEKNITELDFDEISVCRFNLQTLDEMNTLVNSLAKKHQDLRNERQQREIELSEKIRKIVSVKESEIVHLKNQHSLEVNRIKTEFENEIEKAKSDHKTEITQIKNQHRTELDQVDFDFTKEIEQIKQQNFSQINQIKHQHQCELVEIRREINEKPKVINICNSSEDTTKTSEPKRKRITFDDPRGSNEIKNLGIKTTQ